MNIGSVVLEGSPQCQAFGPEKLQIRVVDQLRSMTLFLPSRVQDAPLWLVLHGEADEVNPFKGHGDTYWHESVPDAMKDWAQFNQCSGSFAAPKFLQQAAFLKGSYTGCKDNATVEVIRMPNAGHQWPGATFTIPGGLRTLKSLHSHFGVAFLGYLLVPWNRQRRSSSAMRQWQC